MKKMSDAEKKAKMTALKEAHGMASDMLKGNLEGVKKVTVASDSKGGLKEGLKKAEEMIGHSKDPHESEESDAEEMGETPEEEASEYEPEIPEGCESEDDIDALIAKLEEKKRHLHK